MGRPVKRPWGEAFRDEYLNSSLSCRHGGDEKDPENRKYDWSDLGIVLVRVLQRNRTNRIHMEIMRRRFMMDIGSHDYGGQEVL